MCVHMCISFWKRVSFIQSSFQLNISAPYIHSRCSVISAELPAFRARQHHHRHPTTIPFLPTGFRRLGDRHKCHFGPESKSILSGCRIGNFANNYRQRTEIQNTQSDIFLFFAFMIFYIGYKPCEKYENINSRKFICC